MTNVVSPVVTALVALMKLKGVGRRAALQIVDGPNRKIDLMSFREIVFSRADKARLSESELTSAWDRTEEQLEKGSAAGVQAFSYHDEEYPSRLRTIPDPPAVLFVRGNSKSLCTSKSLAVVGTREPTPFGVKVARKSAQTAAEAGFTIVSGLAHGCDTYGHEGCLEGRGVGVAVMAHGLDRVYPAANRKLAEQLVEHGGCLVSEYPLGVTPFRAAFAERDRIQSGLSDGVLVIETDVKGGTMHTVRFSRDQKRPLACIVHPEKWQHEEKTKGNQQLIRDGWASPIPDGDALMLFLNRVTSASSPSPKVEVVAAPSPEAQLTWAF
jgi:DNA processing protein